MNHKLFESDYGHFDEEKRAYVVTNPETPRPWINVIGNERYGMTISQAGGGFSWVDHSALSVLTRWEMDLVRDNWGKWLYLKDEVDGTLWSAAPQPMRTAAPDFRCIHGLGRTTFQQTFHEIESAWTLIVPTPTKETDDHPTLELWRLRLRNRSMHTRSLSVCSHFMWCLGAAPDSKREFHRLFFDTNFDDRHALITARKHLWEAPSEKYGHWNTDWPHVAFHAVWHPDGSVPEEVQAVGDHQLFVGRHGDWSRPQWLQNPERLSGGFGRHFDPIGALCCPLRLKPGEEAELVFAIGIAENEDAIADDLAPFRKSGAVEEVVKSVEQYWANHLDPVQVRSPDPVFNLLNNTWLPYQAISARLQGRTGYWQQSGAYGFRDQLQDSQVYLPHAPERCLQQIRLHARHQFADGSVYHWWHPLIEVGLQTAMTDDLLWLPFVIHAYLRETGDFEALNLREPFVDESAPASLWDHGARAIQRVLDRFSPRGLPLIGAGDWNDGLSACGLANRGESVWLGHFLHLVLLQWAELAEQTDRESVAEEWRERAASLKQAVNEHGWDGDWYLRGTLDDGRPLGSRACREGRIFLNAQTWAVIAGTAEDERAETAMDSVEKHLLKPYGPLLLTPAFSVPDRAVGYLSRYAPGARENGGVYVHAAVWAIQAACALNRPELAWRIFSSIAPPHRSNDLENYLTEPYVLPGNISGPETPIPGQGGWSWYTGSAAWLRRICLEWILGVRPVLEGLTIAPCLPPDWDEVSFTRPFRGDIFHIQIENLAKGQEGDVLLTVDGEPHPAHLPIRAEGNNRNRKIVARITAPSLKR